MIDRKRLIDDAAKAMHDLDLNRSGISWEESTEFRRNWYRKEAAAALAVFEAASEEAWVVDPYFLASMGPEDRFVGDPPMVTETEASHRREVLRLRAKYDKLKHEFDEYKMNVLAERPDVAEGLKRAAEAAERGETVRKQRYRAEGGHPPTDAEREIIAARRSRREHEEKK